MELRWENSPLDDIAFAFSWDLTEVGSVNPVGCVLVSSILDRLARIFSRCREETHISG